MKLYCAPEVKALLSQVPSGVTGTPEVVVCWTASRLVQVTLVPTETVKLSCMKLAMSAARAGGAVEGVRVPLPVRACIRVGVGRVTVVRVATGLRVAVGLTKRVGLGVAKGVRVGLAKGVRVATGLRVAVGLARGVAVGTSLRVAVGLAKGVRVAISRGVFIGTAVARRLVGSGAGVDVAAVSACWVSPTAGWVGVLGSLPRPHPESTARIATINMGVNKPRGILIVLNDAPQGLDLGVVPARRGPGVGVGGNPLREMK